MPRSRPLRKPPEREASSHRESTLQTVLCALRERSGICEKDELETPGLPERNPFLLGKLFHKERARDTGMGTNYLPAWYAQLRALQNPIRREMHLFTLLVGAPSLRRRERRRGKISIG